MRTMRRQRIIPIVNRTCRPLEVMDDGIVLVIKPGYRRLEDGRVIGAGPNGQPEVEHVPIATANRAMGQNKARGTVNPDDTLDCTFLIGRVGQGQERGDDIGYVEDNADPDAEMLDREMLPEAQRAERLNIRTPRRRSRQDRTMGAGMGAHTLATADGTVRRGIDGAVGGIQPYAGGDS